MVSHVKSGICTGLTRIGGGKQGQSRHSFTFMKTMLTLTLVTMALTQRRPQPGLIHHTDRGPLYNTPAYRDLLQAHGVRASMNGRKVPQDNAMAETFFSTLK